MKLSEYKTSAARKILVYGPPKIGGKTDLVGRLSEVYHLHWFDLEDGIKTLLSSPRMQPAWLSNIELFSIRDTQTTPIAVDTILRVVKGGEQKICHTHGVVNCLKCTREAPEAFTSINVATFDNTKDILVIDSVSQLAASVMNYIKKDAIAKAESNSWNVKPDWDDYAKQGFIMNRIFSILQQAPYNVVCITHEELVEMEEPGKKMLVPIGGTSNFSKTFAKYFDDVVYSNVVNKKHKAASSTTYSGNIVLGSRAGKELEKMETPNLLELFK
jgi:hypothetical protein